MDGIDIRKRFDELVSLRSNLDDTFQDIERYVVPYRGEFFSPENSEQEVNWRRRGIYDSTAPIAADLLASSIHSNLTSPMIPWFHLAFRDDTLNKEGEPKEWLEGVERQIWQTLKESDFNMEIAETYLDLVSYGTAILFQEEISEEEWEGITFTSMPVKDCYFEHGADDKILRVYRRLKFTSLQLKDKFPEMDWDEKVGEDVDTKHDVVFCVFKRPDIKATKKMMAPSARPWGYKYIFHPTSETLEEGGYYTMPVHIPRWKKVSGSRWGHSPAFVCLSDIKQLNETVAQTSEARSKEIDPPMKSTERGVLGDLDLLPGGLTMVTEMDELDRLLSPNPSLFRSNEEIMRLQESIRSTFYVDKLELKESPAMTATEVLARLDKQQRQFAPTLGRLESDLLDPIIEATYDVLQRNGLLPLPPEGLEQADLDIEYIGPIPRSMKNEEAQGTSLWLGEMSGYAQAIPELLDIVDPDALARGLGLARGVPASYMRTDAEIEEIRRARQERQDAMEKVAAAQQLSEISKNMGEVPQEAA
jgi:hypothetical protein